VAFVLLACGRFANKAPVAEMAEVEHEPMLEAVK
jgi:hypothetical protein